MNLNDRALLVQLSISQWMGRKLDKKASKEVADHAGATRSAVRTHKDLLPGCEELANVHSMTNVVRTKFYDNTLPWGLDGMQILTTGNYLPYSIDYRKDRSDWYSLVNTFLGAYEVAKWNAENDKRHTLGALYVPTDYPSVLELEQKFSMDLAIFPVPSTDFRVQIASEELTRIQQDVEARVASAQAVAMREVWQRLFDKVKHIAEKCADPKAIFRDTMIENARELCELLPRLNITDDPNLESLRLEVENKLIHHPDAIRNNPDLRRDTATEAKKIMDAMGVFMGAN
jgi:hypothetical protein